MPGPSHRREPVVAQNVGIHSFDANFCGKNDDYSLDLGVARF